MRTLCEEALAGALSGGAQYADVRVVRTKWESTRSYQGDTAGIDVGESMGVGVRVLSDGYWGFASGSDTSLSGVRQLANRACDLAAATGLIAGPAATLIPIEVVEDEIKLPFEIDPFEVPFDEKLDYLLSVERILRGAPVVRAMAGHLSCARENKVFASSEESYIVQERTATGIGYRALGRTRGDHAIRSVPNLGGQYILGGYEIVDQVALHDDAFQIAEQLTRMLRGAQMPTDIRDVVVSSAVMAHIICETCEVLGSAGAAFLEGAATARTAFQTGELGTLSLGSPVVSIAAVPDLPQGLGTVAYDDEGVAPIAMPFVQDGIWVGTLAGRQHAAALGDEQAHGAMRACGFNRLPVPRLGNLSLQPGEDSLDALFENVELGLFIDAPEEIAISRDGERLHCRCAVGWLIEDGVCRDIVRNPSFSVDLAAFWSQCDAIGNSDEYAVWGLTDRLYQQPSQPISIGCGTSPARFRAISLT